MASAGVLRLELFGRAVLDSPHGAVALSPMQWALVALVYGDPGRRGTRDELVGQLWAGSVDARTRRRLSQLLYEVEQRAPGPIFLKSGSTIRPNPDCVTCDLEEFRKSLDSGDFSAAAKLMARGFLVGLPDVPTAAFDRWIDNRSATLRAELRNRATERWARAENEALWNQRTRDAAEALLYLDPTNEAALRRAMWAKAMCGAPLEATATLEGFVEMNGLCGHDGLEGETRTLLERVRSLSRHRKGTHIERPRPSRADPTLFGREQELAALRPVLAGPIEDGIAVIAVEGEAGLGKTRLVRECLEPAMLQGRFILHTMLAELERDIPLNALIEAMSTQDVARALLALDDPWRSVLLSLMPDYAEVVGAPSEIPYVQPASLQRRLLESVRLLMDEVVREQPILMFIDDFHWVDDSSLAALEYLRRRWSVGSLVLVVAYRPEHVSPGSDLARFLAADSVLHIALGPIGEVAQKQLVREASGGEVSEDVTAGLRELGGGNPLFLIELARQWSEGELQLPMRTIDSIRLPGSIQQLFERRLGRLGTSSIRVLEALSVMAKRVPMSVLHVVSGLAPREVADGLEALDGSGLLRWSGDGVALWHGLVRQAVLGRTSEGRLRWLHGRVGRHLIAIGSEDLDEIALFLDRGCVREEAFSFALLAADQAEEIGAIPEALYFLQVAQRNASADSLVSVKERLATLQYRQCEYSRAHENFRLLTELKGSPCSEDPLTQVRLFDCLSHIDGGMGTGVGRLHELRAALAGMEAWEALALLVRIGVDYLTRTDQVQHVAALLADVTSCLRTANPRVRCLAHQAGFLLRLYDQDVGKGRDHAASALRVARRHDLTDLLPRSLLAQVANLHLDGMLELPLGRTLWKEGLESSERYGDVYARFKLASNIGAFFLDVGDVRQASHYLEIADGLLDGIDLGSGSAHHRFNQADLAIQQGDFGRAESIAKGVQRASQDGAWYGWALVYAVLGRCALEAGRIGAACRYAEQLDAAFPPHSFPLFDFALTTVFRARLMAARGLAHRALKLMEAVEGTLIRINVPQFLRVRHARVRLLLRADRAAAAELGLEGYEQAVSLNLYPLAERFRSARLNAGT